MKQMTNEEILRKAIKKAKWKSPKIKFTDLIIFNTIFSHDFAKCFFGDRLMTQEDYDFDTTNELLPDYNWQYHLQQMVLEPEPLQYLRRFL